VIYYNGDALAAEKARAAAFGRPAGAYSECA
jgi:hypothetical protein